MTILLVKPFDFGAFLSENWQYILSFIVLALIVFGVLTLLGRARQASEKRLESLLDNNVDLYLEVLQKNRLFPLIFTKETRYMYLLDGYLAKCDDDKTLATIKKLDKMSLQPKQKVDFYQKRLSYFVQIHNDQEAVNSCDKLKEFLTKAKASNVAKYREIILEAEAIIKIYVEKDVNFIDALIQKATKTQNNVTRGITQYRVARLAYIKQDKELVDKYLSRAKVNVKGTAYEEIVDKAISDKTTLAD